jgi:hypothetical protein
MMPLADLEKLLKTLCGAPTTRISIAGNSLILWFGTHQGAVQAKCLFIDAPWRYEQAHIVVASSADFHWDEEDFGNDPDYKAAFERICKLLSPLEGAELIAINLDPHSTDLHLEFSGNQVLRNFAIWRGEENWYLHDHEKGLKYSVTMTGVDIQVFDA